MAFEHEPDPTPMQPGDENAEGRVRYGGGHQEGGGMVEPQEFADGGTDVLDEQPDHISVGVTDEDAERTP